MGCMNRIITVIFLIGSTLLSNGYIQAMMIIVDSRGSGDYLTIKDGMLSANPGDTVYVMPGTYYEYGIRMKENVILQGSGADQCIIDGGDGYYRWPDNFVIYCDSITGGSIDGFTITYPRGGGIGFINSVVSITNNTIVDCYSRGILCFFDYPIKRHPTINGNTITGNSTGLYYILDGLDHTVDDTLDVSNNWWGTVVEAEIQAGIQDLEGSEAHYHVKFKPWLSEEVDRLEQKEEGIHWNNIYNNSDINVSMLDTQTDVNDSDESGLLPYKVTLFQNCPNPFNLCTFIKYRVSNQTNGNISLKIYNILGNEVRILFDADQNEGEYQVIWDGKDETGMEVSSGIYFYTLKSGNSVYSKKMMLIR